MTELDRELGVKDKTLAEFILNLATQSKSVDAFSTNLMENGADFSIDLINTLYAMISKVVKPGTKAVENGDSVKKPEE